MSLVSRLVQPLPTEEKISTHAFASAMSELDRNPFSRTLAQRKSDVIGGFGLSAPEEVDLDDLLSAAATRITGLMTDHGISRDEARNIYRSEFMDILYLGARGRHYSLTQVETRLGV